MIYLYFMLIYAVSIISTAAFFIYTGSYVCPEAPMILDLLPPPEGEEK